MKLKQSDSAEVYDRQVSFFPATGASLVFEGPPEDAYGQQRRYAGSPQACESGGSSCGSVARHDAGPLSGRNSQAQARIAGDDVSVPRRFHAEEAAHSVHQLRFTPEADTQPVRVAPAFEELVRDCNSMHLSDSLNDWSRAQDSLQPCPLHDVERQGSVYTGDCDRDERTPDMEYEDRIALDLDMNFVSESSVPTNASTGTSADERPKSARRSVTDITELRSRLASSMADTGSWTSEALRDTCCNRGRCVKAVRDFPQCCAYCPVSCCCLTLLCLFALAGLAWPGIAINVDFGSFLQVDGECSEAYSALQSARSQVGYHNRRLDEASDEANASDTTNIVDLGATGYMQYVLNIYYIDKIGAGAYSYEVLQAIHEFEKEMRSQPWYARACSGSDPNVRVMCNPGFSAANVVWAEREESEDDQPQNIPVKVNGQGYDPFPLHVAYTLANSVRLTELLFPSGFKVGHPSKYLRSSFILHLEFCVHEGVPECSLPPGSNVNDMYKSLLREEIIPFLERARDKFDSEDPESSPHISIAWAGNGISTVAVTSALLWDVMKAGAAAIFIVLYLSVHTGSFLVSISALGMTILGLPFAFITLAQMSGSNELGGVAFAALCLIIGVGADIVLVFTSVWCISLKHFDREDTLGRVKYVNKQAGVACFFTAATTSCSFFSNLTSSLRPLREFGLFMGLCIMWTYVFLCLSLPSILIMREWWVQRDFCGRCRCRPRGCSRSITKDRDKLPSCSRRLRGRDYVKMYVEKVLIPFRRSLCVFFTVLPFALLGWTSQVVQIAGSEVDTFPDDHNENIRMEVAKSFGSGATPWDWGAGETMICNVGREPVESEDEDPCALHWCNIDVAVNAEVVRSGKKAESGISSECVCRPTAVPSTTCRPSTPGEGQWSTVTTRFVGQRAFHPEFWESQEWDKHILEVTRLAHSSGEVDTNSLQLGNASLTYNELVQMHWESGATYIESFMLAPMSRMMVRSKDQVCDVDEICYCGSPMCRIWEDGTTPSKVPVSRITTVYGPPLDIPSSDDAITSTSTITSTITSTTITSTTITTAELASPIDAIGMDSDAVSNETDETDKTDEADDSAGPMFIPGFEMQTTPAPPPALPAGNVEVNMVWGVQMIEGAQPFIGKVSQELWSFDLAFRTESPNVQRYAVEVCKDARTANLKVVRDYCWMEAFRDWTRSRGGFFPALGVDFNFQVLDFLQQGGMVSDRGVANFVWYKDSERVAAFFYTFVLNLDTSMASTVLAEKDRWSEFTTTMNLNAPVGMEGGWFASRQFKDAEAMDSIIRSTITSMLISAGCGFAGALVSTHFDIVLSTVALMSVIAVIICLFWFICAVLQWPVGPFEVLGLIIFVGYSITYAIHITHKYQENLGEVQHIKDTAARRREAVTRCLSMMASAILGSAATTLGSSMCLFFCILVVFVKIAGILFAVTFFSALYAIVVVPAVFLWIGPSQPLPLRRVVSCCDGFRQNRLEPTIAL